MSSTVVDGQYFSECSIKVIECFGLICQLVSSVTFKSNFIFDELIHMRNSLHKHSNQGKGAGAPNDFCLQVTNDQNTQKEQSVTLNEQSLC